jgi:aminopeptidase-like protein
MPRESIHDVADYFERLWPLFRSITGHGERGTHDIIGELVPLDRLEIPSNTQCFDWTVPREWIVNEAYVIAPDGRRILDIADNNLHLVNYSVPFRGRITREHLEKHLHSLPNQPTAIPYVTTYYNPYWGFCISHDDRQSLPSGEYEVVVDTDFVDGALTISEAVLPGIQDKEVLFSTYTCHPSLANDNLSGPLVAAFLYRRLAAMEERRLTYRFVFLPETIGSIAYLGIRGDHLVSKTVAGYVVTCVGDPAPFSYKRSRQGNSFADRIVEHVLKTKGTYPLAGIMDFSPTGSDERQYCSPGFDLPIGSIMRSQYGTYKEYHTSLDNKDFISFDAMQESIDLYFEVCRTLEMACTYRNKIMACEPHLGRRGLYPSIGAGQEGFTNVRPLPLLWVLNLSDGHHDLLDISQRCGIDMNTLHAAASQLLHHDLIERTD